MKTAALWLATAALAGTAISPVSAMADEPGDKSAEKDNTAAVLGGLAAIGIGIAVTTAKHGDTYRHDRQWDGKLYGDPFMPAANVVCAPGQRQCYERGYYSYGWTKRVFGASAAFADAGEGMVGSFGDFGTLGVDLDRARTVCLEQSAGNRLKNVTIDEAKQMTDEWAYVYMRARPNPRLPDYQRWRCAYSFKSGKTDFKRM